MKSDCQFAATHQSGGSASALLPARPFSSITIRSRHRCVYRDCARAPPLPARRSRERRFAIAIREDRRDREAGRASASACRRAPPCASASTRRACRTFILCHPGRGRPVSPSNGLHIRSERRFAGACLASVLRRTAEMGLGASALISFEAAARSNEAICSINGTFDQTLARSRNAYPVAAFLCGAAMKPPSRAPCASRLLAGAREGFMSEAMAGDRRAALNRARMIIDSLHLQESEFEQGGTVRAPPPEPANTCSIRLADDVTLTHLERVGRRFTPHAADALSAHLRHEPAAIPARGAIASRPATCS